MAIRKLALAAAALAAWSSAQTEPQYDLLLKGGHVIDAKNRLSAIRDVAIKDGRIAAVAENIPDAAALKTVNVAGLRFEKGSFGFVDMHGARMDGSTKLVAEMTVRDGKLVWDLNGLARERWDKLPAGYGPQGDARWDAYGRPQRRLPAKQ